MRKIFRTSGDLIADRRYGYAMELFNAGDFRAAAELFEQAVERAPNWPDAWFGLARARRECREDERAAQALRACLALDPADTLGASLELSRLDAATPVATAPPAYVRALFDAYAGEFDEALVERLAYKTPQELAQLLREAISPPRIFDRALDLGCGTGLSGQAIIAEARWLEGVDLSDGMIARARDKGVYDALHMSDALAFLAASGAPYDLILAADVFNYLGDLDPVIAAAAARLAPGGALAFSIEKGGAAAFEVLPSLRFAHAPAYVEGLLRREGLGIAAVRESVLRKDRGADVAGVLFLAVKPLA